MCVPTFKYSHLSSSKKRMIIITIMILIMIIFSVRDFLWIYCTKLLLYLCGGSCDACILCIVCALKQVTFLVLPHHQWEKSAKVFLSNNMIKWADSIPIPNWTFKENGKMLAYLKAHVTGNRHARPLYLQNIYTSLLSSPNHHHHHYSHKPNVQTHRNKKRQSFID